MTLSISRSRLLAGAALGLGLSILAPQQAMAACNNLGNGIDCVSNTTTFDTTYPTNSPNDRGYEFFSTVGPVFLTVEPGIVVDGYGLSFTDQETGTNTMTVTNDGSIIVNPTNTASAGGLDGALGLTGVNIPIIYSGTGDILNLGIGDGFETLITGTGSLSAVIGGSVQASAGDAVVVDSTNAAGGAINITTTAGETIRASGGDGIEIDTAGSGDATVVNNAAISSSPTGVNTLQDGINVDSTGTGSINVSGNGAIGTAGDRAQLTGINASISNAASAGNVTVSTGTGGVFSVGTGVEGSTTGTGNVLVTVGTGGVDSTTGLRGAAALSTTGTATLVSNGAVTTGGVAAAALYANSTTGAVSVTANAAATAAGAGSAGISANSTSGNVTIVANGNVTGDYGIFSNSGGTRSITVNAGKLVDGGTQAAIFLSGAGASTISNAGTIGSASTDLAVDSAAAGATTINSSGTINGRVNLSAGADSLSNTGTINTQGISDFGAGVDVMNNLAAGTINLTGATTLTNLETLTNSGRINLDTFTLTGTGIAFTNTGTIDTNGSAGLAGFTTFSNAGVLDLAPGVFTTVAGTFTNSGTILADEGISSITGQTTFANSGTIDLQDGAVGDNLTINSPFVGSGASTLLVDFDDTTSDELILTGAASGTTTVNANAIGTGLINLGGVQVIDGTTATTDAFVLGSVTGNVSPLIDYSLAQTGGDFFLVSAPNIAAFNPLIVPALVTSMWYQSADEVLAETRKPATTVGFSFWGDIYLSRDKYGDDSDTAVIAGIPFDVDNEIETKRHGLQLGADYGFGSGRVGLTAGYAWAKSDAESDFVDNGIKAKGWNLGLYGQFGGITGFHGEALIKYDSYSGDFDNGVFDGIDVDFHEFGIDGAVGYRFGIGGDANLDANVGVSHVVSKADDFDAFGFSYDIGKVTSTRGRAGLRATFGGGIAPYVDATVYHEFNGNGDVELFDGATDYSLDTNGKGTWVRLEGGLSGNDGPGPILALWGDLGDKTGFGLRAGWRLGGGVAEALPPPPPPVVAPPPPPPATQTCPDGSVILATDACPPPPPPPPPPPEPERG